MSNVCKLRVMAGLLSMGQSNHGTFQLMKRLFWLLFLLFLVKSTVWADGGLPLTFLGARPLGTAEQALISRYTVAQMFGLLNGSTPVPDPLNQKMTVEMAALMYGRGITKDFTLVTALPYINKVMQSQTGRNSNAGVGDLQLFGLLRLWHADYGPDNTTLSFLFGSSFPTGFIDAKNAQGNLLPPTMQLGLGTLSPLLGAVYTAESNMGQSDFQVTYQQGFTNAQGFNPGNTLSYNLRYGYRLFPHKRFAGSETYLALELDGALSSKGLSNGVTNTNSGGHTVSLAPVVQQVMNENLLLEFGYVFPIVRNFNGIQLAPQNTWIVGLRYLK